MKEENKELVFSDIAIYLPYELKCLNNKGVITIITSLEGVSCTENDAYLKMGLYSNNELLKSYFPLLRPMSSMTEEEKSQYKKLGGHVFEFDLVEDIKSNFEAIKYCASKMLDFADLIGQGKALNINDYKDKI